MEVGGTFKAVSVVTINRKAAAWLYSSKSGSRSFGLPCILLDLLLFPGGPSRFSRTSRAV
jgi:hypothetical protein